MHPINCNLSQSLKFIIGKVPNGTENVLELVHATEILNITTSHANVPAKSWRLVEGDVTGVPPCKVADLQFQSQFKMPRGKPVANVQLLLCIDDTGDERGVMDRDNDLLRVKRKAICCLSGKPVALCRTGDV